MLKPPHRTLCFLLRAFSLLAALGGLFMVFAERPMVVRTLLRPPEGQVSTLLLSLLKEMGGLALMLAVLLWLAARDPVRNVAIVDGLIAGLCILAMTPVVSLWMTDIRNLYPAYLIWGRSVVRLAIAALLFVALRSAQDRGNRENSGCRPHRAASKQHSREGSMEQRRADEKRDDNYIRQRREIRFESGGQRTSDSGELNLLNRHRHDGAWISHA